MILWATLVVVMVRVVRVLCASQVRARHLAGLSISSAAPVVIRALVILCVRVLERLQLVSSAVQEVRFAAVTGCVMRILSVPELEPGCAWETVAQKVRSAVPVGVNAA